MQDHLSLNKTMRTVLISNIRKWIPRKWWFIFGIVLAIYILFTYIVTETTLVSSEKKHRLDLALDNINLRNHQSEAVVINNNMKVPGKEHIHTAGVSDNQKVSVHKDNGNQQQIQPPEQIVVEAPLEVEIPHLIFNDKGMGQMGSCISINRTKLSEDDKKLFDQGYERNAFNEYASNLISVDRTIAETRDPECLNKTYPDDLPNTSVIITFLNEAWSVLVRTVHSIINTTPPHLLKEIILVDDHSDYDYLKAPLELYMKKFPVVKIIRNSEREGLIRTRLNGAKVATGKVLTFLDSHVECTKDWLPPLLARIKENSTNVVWPVIPNIDHDTFKFATLKSARNVQMGVFTWHLQYSWEQPNLEERKSVISPIKSPTMAGGLFSIDREYFYYIGSYDEEMRFWGAENLEISFRIWMCGGSIEIIPCSIIGHVFRERNPNKGHSDAIRINTLRTAMVWLDEFKYLYAHVSGTKLENYGDISSRLSLRQRLKCKSFKWYLTNVYNTVFRPDIARGRGMIHSVHDSSKCIYSMDRLESTVTVKECNKNEIINQIFYLTDYEEIRLLGHCLDAGKGSLIVYICHKMKGSQHFIYRQLQIRFYQKDPSSEGFTVKGFGRDIHGWQLDFLYDNTIFHPTSGKCVQWIEQTSGVRLYPCDRNPRQMWMLENIPLNLMHKDNDNIQ